MTALNEFLQAQMQLWVKEAAYLIREIDETHKDPTCEYLGEFPISDNLKEGSELIIAFAEREDSDDTTS